LFIHTQIGYVPGVGVIDESGFVKKGSHSAGVARQYCGRIGKVENCQVGVFLGYVTPHGSAFLDRRLYLTQDWCEDEDRRHRAGIPDAVGFQTKPQLAQQMLEQAWSEDVPMQWATGDTAYGNSPGLRNAINRQDKYYVLAIANHHAVILADEQRVKLKALPAQLTDQSWLSLASRISERGLIGYEWLGLRVTMPNDEIDEQWLLVRRTYKDEPEYTFYLSNAPEDVPLTDLVAVANARHSIEELLEKAKSEVGLADYEVRSWDGWHRHMTLVMLAHTWLKLIQHREREKKTAAELAEFQPG
jgi:SRSO17 transposase